MRTTHASTESAGRNRPKSPILYGSWPGGGSDADATDHRDQNHFRDLLVPPGLLRHQYCHVRPDRRRSFCLFTQGQVPTRTAVLRPDRGDTGIRPNHQSRDPGAIDAGDRRLAVAHFFRRLGRIRALSRRSVFSGVVVSLALTRSSYPIGKVYGADLIGAATGCIGVLALLNVMSGPSAVLWVGGLIALAALGFAGSGVGALPKFTSLGSQLFRYRRSIVTGCLLLAIANTFTSHGVRPTIVKDHLG